MVATIQQLIATINPDLYYDYGDDKSNLKSFKEMIKSEGFQQAAEKAKPKPLTYVIKDGQFNLSKQGTEAEHTLVYDSSSETLEPIYFFILDLMNDFGFDAEKLVDNFTSSPGSGHFSELGQKATMMQQQATKVMGDVNTVLRSVLNIIYDLRDFRTRLQHYDNLDSDDKEKRQGALLALKQIWMDKVDVQKGNSSIKAMALGQAGYQTLIDAFLVAENEKDVEKLDLNDRVRRILLPRIQEFNVWVKESGRELRKRYQLEKTYLRSQVNSLKLYSRWVKPYLMAAQKLEMKEQGREAALVKTFNTILLELTLLGKSKIDPKKSALAGDFPKEFASEKFLRTFKRDYYACVLVDFRFRGIPQRTSPQQSHYVFGGRAEITFSAYALNQDELDKLDEELEKSDIGDVLKLVQGATAESLGTLQEDINFFLKEDDEEKTEKTKQGSNPFVALIGGYNKKSESKKSKKPKIIDEKKNVVVRPEDFIEKEHLRPYTAGEAQKSAFELFDVYKKAHGMPSYT